MKRSAINRIIREAETFLAGFQQALPPFAHWRPEDWRQRREEAALAIERGLGWDITDFGAGDFARRGLAIVTLRNGALADVERGRGMLYCEKALIAREGQLTPLHFHKMKAEDIINRGGGTLVLELYAATVAGDLDTQREVTVLCDGLRRTVAPGGHIRLAPGESITLMPGDVHAFWAEGGDVYVGEVSTVNDDQHDNYFIEPVGRFPTIEEDEAPYRLLVGDYATALAR